MEIASPSCRGIISTCEKPFIGMDVRKECAGVDFTQTCRHAGCAAELCTLFEVGIDKCQKLCKLGPLSDDCQKCPRNGAWKREEVREGKSIIDAINSLPSKKKKKGKKNKKKSKKAKKSKKQSKKPLLFNTEMQSFNPEAIKPDNVGKWQFSLPSSTTPQTTTTTTTTATTTTSPPSTTKPTLEPTQSTSTSFMNERLPGITNAIQIQSTKSPKNYPRFGDCEARNDLKDGSIECYPYRVGFISARCVHRCNEGKWLHGYHKIQCRNGKWEEYSTSRFSAPSIIDMDIDLTKPICIDHCPCREANACQAMPVELNKSLSMKIECPIGGRIRVQGAVYGRWDDHSCTDDIYMDRDFPTDVCPQTRKVARVCYGCSDQEACWSQWSSWGECSAECGSGIKTRQRACVKFGDEDCEGSKFDTEQCNTEPCGCPENTPCKCVTHLTPAGQSLLKYDCSNLRLTNTNTVSAWPEAEYLDLSNNSLFSSLYLRAFLQQMPNLKRIDLDGNYLTEVVEDLFASNPALEFLNFLNNRVTSVPEKLFSENPELEVVWFSGNKLAELPQNLFQQNRNLLFVDFSRNFIKKMPRYLFRNNFFLDEVHFEANTMERVCRDQFRTNPNLRIVSFVGNGELPELIERAYCSGFKFCYSYGGGPISVLLALLNVYGDACYQG
ncbi:Oidioi.mRNA.OKI2018_I69.chr2.g5477.t1.cds [Oikopleura dioica]|uniref:Oidioi.mRNA.OKI2018_I69.chr2.g5477.t1.cds n=1 Tax=Oikopleura dioica TaxID=34765 RepID=A0ABN7T0J6_OIKDI|nr:Oidioi.mRNA.OKI2018_I69.chr2.g5477.t1.cds [Oikopleura dioica]